MHQTDRAGGYTEMGRKDREYAPRDRPRIARGAHDSADFTERGAIQISLLLQYLEYDGGWYLR